MKTEKEKILAIIAEIQAEREADLKKQEVLVKEQILAATIQKQADADKYRVEQDALAEQARSGAVDLHRVWIEGLLREYYDPMYRYQLEKKAAKIVFRGTWQDVADWLNAQ